MAETTCRLDAEAHLRRAAVLRAAGREEEAIGELRRAVGLEPGLAEAYLQLGNALKAIGRYGEALAPLGDAVRLAPKSAVAWLNLGVTQLELHRREPAAASFQTAVTLEPGRPEAHNILGVALMELGKLSEARLQFTEARRLNSSYAAAHGNLGCVLKAQRRISEAIASFRTAVALSQNAATHSNLLYALNFAPGITPETICLEHRSWAEAYERPLRAAPPVRSENRAAGGRIRIGFVSADFIDHAIAYFFEPLLASLDRGGFDVTCYSDVRVPDRVTARFRAISDRWRECAQATDERLEALVREDRIDVLVDLSGHTAGNRLRAFARKPAPVQVTWLGYPNTTGLSAIDYRVTDSVADPPGTTEMFHSEKLLRLAGPFLCYHPPSGSPPVSPLPASTFGRVTFASFSNLAKLSDPCLELWARILHAVSESRLTLKSRGLDDGETLESLRARFRELGVSPDRIETSARLVQTEEHLSLYHGVDVALDPFPYNGTTTTCEALWMGVPVVTLAGRTHVHRVGASLLTALGAPEWVANTEEEYLKCAVGLANDRERLAKIRSRLRSRMAESPLCDERRFADEFAAAIRSVCVGAQGGAESPEVP